MTSDSARAVNTADRPWKAMVSDGCSASYLDMALFGGHWRSSTGAATASAVPTEPIVS